MSVPENASANPRITAKALTGNVGVFGNRTRPMKGYRKEDRGLPNMLPGRQARAVQCDVGNIRIIRIDRKTSDIPSPEIGPVTAFIVVEPGVVENISLRS